MRAHIEMCTHRYTRPEGLRAAATFNAAAEAATAAAVVAAAAAAAEVAAVPCAIPSFAYMRLYAQSCFQFFSPQFFSQNPKVVHATSSL